MEKHDFHTPFIKELAIVGLVTIVSMLSVEYFINFVSKSPQNTPTYTSAEIENTSNWGFFS